jgi:hypothetical protein
MTWSLTFFALVFCKALIAGPGWGFGNIIAAKALR